MHAGERTKQCNTAKQEAFLPNETMVLAYHTTLVTHQFTQQTFSTWTFVRDRPIGILAQGRSADFHSLSQNSGEILSIECLTPSV